LDKLYGDGFIKLTLGDWMWNASLTGFINIVGTENVSIKGSTAIVPIGCMEHFEEKYFKYLIDTYERILPWYKVKSFEKIIEHYRKNGFESLDLQGLKYINVYVKDVAKRYLASNSMKSAFELMGNGEYINSLEKGLQKVREPGDEAAFEKEKNNVVEEVKKQFEILGKILEYWGSEKGRRFIGAKNVIYKIIRNGWDGVSFLNPQTRITDVYGDYRRYFVESAIDYIGTSGEKYKYKCFNCGAPIKDLNNEMSFLNQSGFDVSRKTSHVWNFVNDIAICPVCKLVFSCVPAGFAYVSDTGLFINANLDLKYCMRINYNIKEIIKNEDSTPCSRKTCSLVAEILIKQKNAKQKYRLADVQVVRYEQESYKFNLFSEETINLIDESKEEISGLMRAGYRDGKDCFSAYEQVLEHIFNNQNLFPIIHKLLHYKTSKPNCCFFHSGHILRILKINFRWIGKSGGMKNISQSLHPIKGARDSGLGLRELYLKRDPGAGKLPGLGYRLINSLKTGSRNMFMDILLNLYLYLGKEVPEEITEALRDEDDIFKTIGYAFVAGFITGKRDENKMAENRGENENE
jgi:CRISPR-associated protein Cst1